MLACTRGGVPVLGHRAVLKGLQLRKLPVVNFRADSDAVAAVFTPGCHLVPLHPRPSCAWWQREVGHYEYRGTGVKCFVQWQNGELLSHVDGRLYSPVCIYKETIGASVFHSRGCRLQSSLLSIPRELILYF